jgi:Kef-type K+ transport system membrane component KefB
MKKSLDHLLFYVVSMVIALALLFTILHYGSEDGQTLLATLTPQSSFSDLFVTIKQEFMSNMSAPIAGLLMQIFVILAFSRICATILKKFGQPQVIGEMIAGILLGKSVFALIWPVGFETLFPEALMPRLYFLSQIGLILFMFVVGLDLKISELKNRASSAILISHVSIVVPFLLGTLIALGIYKQYAPPQFVFSSFALFMGIAMSITAFPVLARIIQEKKLTGTPLGTMALTCAAIDDVTAWCVLAAVVGIVKAGTMTTAIGVFLVAAVYVFVMIKAIKPLMAIILKSANDGEFTHGQIAIIFCLVLASSWLSEIIGIHALFGAFLAGTIMPSSFSLRENLKEKIEDLSAVVLLPIFFAYTGIRMQIGLMNTTESWIICGIIIFFAIFGKMVGSALAARYSGMSWRDSWGIGALMNTRGLMELVVLNIGYDIGILTPMVFSMMVIMAIMTTAMTGPMLSFLGITKK